MRLLKDRFEHKAGTVVYRCHLPNYGCVSDDNRFFPELAPHIAVTLDPDGGYPFFTVPERDVEMENHPTREG